jgi:hypothetical protein
VKITTSSCIDRFLNYAALPKKSSCGGHGSWRGLQPQTGEMDLGMVLTARWPIATAKSAHPEANFTISGERHWVC